MASSNPRTLQDYQDKAASQAGSGAKKNTVDPATNDGTHTTSDMSGVMASVREGTQTGK